MSNLLRISLVATSLFAFAACGDDDGETPSGNTLAAADLPAAYVRATCEKLFSCCTADQLAEQFGDGAPTDVDNCIELLNAQIDFADLLGEIDSGKITYDGASAYACVGEITTASCDLFSLDDAEPPTAACRATFTGTVAEGGACATSEACTGGALCVGEPKTCVARSAIGTTCGAAECVDGAHCDGNGMCVADIANGMGCFASRECASGYCDMPPAGAAGAPPGTCMDAPPLCEATR